MLQILPFIVWIAPIASGVALAALWSIGDLRRGTAAALLGWLLLAAYFQFFGKTPVVTAAGLLFQSILAIALCLRWKLAD